MEEIRKQISQGQLEFALNNMKKIIPRHLDDDFIQLQNRFNIFQKNKMREVLSKDEIIIEEKKISESIKQIYSMINVEPLKIQQAEVSKLESNIKSNPFPKRIFISYSKYDRDY
ncbi:MAG: hypothetical protein AAGI38_12205, partial [Bacteroidota bacterium]